MPWSTSTQIRGPGSPRLRYEALVHLDSDARPWFTSTQIRDPGPPRLRY
ncbi:hypothetical protein scyTo_0027455, partial [Scyliorhinus torazame]|nr:hypothetical protein [Scyliorhinus torazame]